MYHGRVNNKEGKPMYKDESLFKVTIPALSFEIECNPSEARDLALYEIIENMEISPDPDEEG
jgi:hypothetical protein|tara:strand:+ start:361 stop:546 length:186 start_codon:yes stop_codon:yes gene_type:complete